MRVWILTATAAMLPAAAQAADMMLDVSSVRLTAPIPAGYCVPTGNDQRTADIVANGDPDNLTLATLIRCDRAGRTEGPGNDYMLIKTPKSTLGTTMARTEFLKAISAEFGKAEWQSGSSSKQATARAEKDLSNTLSTPVEISGTIGPRGSDGDCAYLGGTLDMNGAGVAYPIILGGCVTTAGEKVIGVYTYDDPDKGGGVAGKMRTARDVAMTIRPLP